MVRDIAEDRVDGVWKSIAAATTDGALGVAAKVSTNGKGLAGYRDPAWRGTYLVCAYTSDFRDAADVARALRGLRRAGVRHRVYYKADIVTLAGLYSGNRFR